MPNRRETIEVDDSLEDEDDGHVQIDETQAEPGILPKLLQKKEEEAEALRYVRDTLVEEMAELESREERTRFSYEVCEKVAKHNASYEEVADDTSPDALFEHLETELQAEAHKRKESFRGALDYLKTVLKTMESQAGNPSRNRKSTEEQAVDERESLQLMDGKKDIPGLIQELLQAFIRGRSNGYVSVTEYCPAMVASMANTGMIVFHPSEATKARLGIESEMPSRRATEGPSDAR